MAKPINIGLIDQPQLDETGRVMQAPQSVNDRHGDNYDNDVSISSWLRNGNATTKPGFDKHRSGGK
jgi:hypothetical protein